VKALNLGLAFLLELAALAALAYWGYRLDASAGVRWVVALGAPLALALTWSRIAAPTARRRLARTPLLAFKLLVFTVAAALLYSTGRHALAILFEAATLLNLALGAVWEQ
jgi:Protein of unknown function (DUF2568)